MLTKADRIQAEVASEWGGCGQEERRTIEKFLDAARNAASFSSKNPLEYMRFRIFGHTVSHAYVNLHAASVLWARNTPACVVDLRLERARARLSAIEETTSPRTPILRELLRESPKTLAEKRDTLAAILEWIYSVSDTQHARVRRFRNIVWASAVGLALIMIIVGVLGTLQPDAIKLCFNADPTPPDPTPPDPRQYCPTGNSSSRRDTVLIEILGLLGGAVSAIVAIRRLEGKTVPFSVPLALAALKMPMGAVTALLGLLLIHGRFVPGLTNLDSPGQILAYAVVLGAAQQLVTQVVDRQGRDVLERLPDKRVESSAADRRISLDTQPRDNTRDRLATTRQGRRRR